MRESPRFRERLQILVALPAFASVPALSTVPSDVAAAAIHDGHLYELRVSSAALSWHQARSAAATLGCHLATVSDAEENEVLAALLDAAAASGSMCDGVRQRSWIGFTDEVSEGDWRWVTSQAVSFTAWDDGEPNDFGGIEDHAVMSCPGAVFQRGRWNDTRVDHPSTWSFFCERLEYQSWPAAALWGGPATAVATEPGDDSIAYLGTRAGVYKTTDTAATWRPSRSGMGVVEVRDLVVDPVSASVVFAGTSQGVYVSHSGGASWNATNTGLTSLEVRGLEIDPLQPSRVYAETDDGLFRSDDGGISWSPMANAPCDWLTVDPQQPSTLHTGCLYATYKSTDHGQTWEPGPTFSFLDPSSVWAVNPHDSQNILFAGWFESLIGSLESYDVWQSTDGGTSFQSANLTNLCESPFRSIAFGATDAVFALDDTGLARSSDGGQSWVRAGAAQGLLTGNRGYQLAAAAAGVFAGTRMGLMTSFDQGETWAPGSRGLRHSAVGELVGGPPGYPIAALADGGVQISVDQGQSWTPVLSDTVGEGVFSAIAISPGDPSILYAGSTAYPCATVFLVEGRIWRSIDGGQTWEQVGHLGFDTEVQRLAVHPASSSIVYLGAGFFDPLYSMEVLRSTDGGGSWTGLSTIPEDGEFADLIIDPTQPDILYAALTGFGDPVIPVYKSLDGGITWAAAASGLPAADINDLAIDPLNPSVLYAAPEGGGLYRTADGASTWSPAANGAPSGEVSSLAVDPWQPGRIYAATAAAAYRSTDGGSSWEPMAVVDVRSVLVTNPGDGTASEVWGGTAGRGLLRLDESVIFRDGFESGGIFAWIVGRNPP